MEYYSHVFFNEKNEVEKRKRLELHLNEVFKFSTDNLPKIFLDNTNQLGYSETEVKKVIEIISFCHDFGKFNSKFQEFIRLNPDQKKEFKDKKLKEHSLISAIFGFFIAKNIFIEENEKSIFLRSLVYYLIKMHHSNLENFEDEMHFVENMDLLRKQLELIDKESYEFYSKLFKIKDIDNKFRIFINNLPNQDSYISYNFDNIEEKLFENNKDFSVYFIINTFFSLLHDADVHSASDVNYTPKRISNYDFVREYINNLSMDNKNINKERTEIFWKLDKKASAIDLKKRIYQITSPTGSGKTFSSLNFALQLKKRLKEETKNEYKIIYSIPFTSIIDQTFNNFSNLLDGAGLSSDMFLLRHHHLTDLSKEIYKNENETYISPELNSVIVESWKFDLIVTTFIQLFESVISNNKEMIKKTHNLYNSIIIVDECQNIPVKYWDTLKDLLKQFSLFFDVYFVFLTATQPLIFDKDEENAPLELLDGYYQYFFNKNRTEIIPIIEEKELEQFYEYIQQIILKNNYSSILIVLNTVKDSQDIYRKVNDDISLSGYKKIYLSASLIPKTKIDNIELIKKLNQINKTQKIKEKYIAVSTQLIEAGVDIDNEVIFRDFAPIENLIQTAGRCNREGERNTEKVYVFNIKKNERQRASTIYSSYLLRVSENLLKEYTKNGIFESKYLQLFEKYIKLKRESSNMVLKLEESIKELKYYDEDMKNEPIASFKIINQKINKISCFINIDKESQEVLSAYIETKKINDFRIKNEKWLPYKNKFQRYIVDIPEKIVQLKVNDYFAKYQKKPKLLILDKDEWNNYYDLILGYIDLDYIWI